MSSRKANYLRSGYEIKIKTGKAKYRNSGLDPESLPNCDLN